MNLRREIFFVFKICFRFTFYDTIGVLYIMRLLTTKDIHLHVLSKVSPDTISKVTNILIFAKKYAGSTFFCCPDSSSISA